MSEMGNLKIKENSQKAKLLRAISRIEHDKKINFWEEVAKVALFGKDKSTLNTVIKKLVPDEAKIEHSGDSEKPIEININKTYKDKAI